MRCHNLIGFIFLLILSANTQAEDKPSVQLSLFINTTKDVLSMAHGNAVPLAVFPSGIPSLGNTPIANMLAFTSVVRDKNGNQVGIASELEEFPANPQDGTPLVWDTLWTVMLQGRGSLYLYQQEIMIKEDVEMFMSTLQTGKAWEGNRTHPTTHGPLPNGHGIIKGGTGEFEGATGTFQEIITLNKFTPAGELSAVIELQLDMNAGK